MIAHAHDHAILIRVCTDRMHALVMLATPNWSYQLSNSQIIAGAFPWKVPSADTSSVPYVCVQFQLYSIYMRGSHDSKI